LPSRKAYAEMRKAAMNQGRRIADIAEAVVTAHKLMGGERSDGHGTDVGFLPLVDACLPILAREHGFAEAEGISLRLVKDMSWATVLDRLALWPQRCRAHGRAAGDRHDAGARPAGAAAVGAVRAGAERQCR
jgi:hypothetical protein